MPGTDKIVQEAKPEKFCKLISATFQMHFSEPNLGLGFFYFDYCAIEIYIGDKSQAMWVHLLFLESR